MSTHKTRWIGVRSADFLLQGRRRGLRELLMEGQENRVCEQSASTVETKLKEDYSVFNTQMATTDQ